MITLKEADDNYKSLWALNDKYPDYIQCVIFDHKNPPYHDIELCKERFKKLVKNATDKKIAELTLKIEIAEEEGDSVSYLFAQRKLLRSYYSIDISGCKSIEDLIALYPKDL